MNIQLATLDLVRYNEAKHQLLKDELTIGSSHSEFLHDIAERLINSKNNIENLYQSAFIVEDYGQPIGYLYISSMINDEVFLEYAISKEFRGMHYGSDLVSEVTDYLFENHNIKSIRLDIDPSNESSIRVATSCGYMIDEERFATNGYRGKIQFIRENEFYLSKRRK